MNQPDRRWVRRFNNFVKAFAQLQEAVELSQQRELSYFTGFAALRERIQQLKASEAHP